MNNDKKNTFNSFIQTALNKPQQEAVLQKNGALLVTAAQDQAKHESSLHALLILF